MYMSENKMSIQHLSSNIFEDKTQHYQITPEQFNELKEKIISEKGIILTAPWFAADNCTVSGDNNTMTMDTIVMLVDFPPKNTFFQRLRWIFTGKF